MINICHCGSQAGFTHNKYCPFPLFRDGPDQVALWKKEYDKKQTHANEAMDKLDLAMGDIDPLEDVFR